MSPFPISSQLKFTKRVLLKGFIYKSSSKLWINIWVTYFPGGELQLFTLPTITNQYVFFSNSCTKYLRGGGRRCRSSRPSKKRISSTFKFAKQIHDALRRKKWARVLIYIVPSSPLINDDYWGEGTLTSKAPRHINNPDRIWASRIILINRIILPILIRVILLLVYNYF